MKRLLLLTISSLFFLSCASSSTSPNSNEDCSDGIDNDGDGFVDCEDNDCGLTSQCQNPSNEVNCQDQIDNDNDGKTDCQDPDCAMAPLCVGTETNCNDGVDNDSDGKTDCQDPDCATTSICLGPELDCDDNQDNDNDGNTDCDDADCNNDPACANVQQEICDDNQDNDGDGSIDCEDPNCIGDPSCRPSSETEVPGGCSDGVDNDQDNTTDCDDWDCMTDPACVNPTRETNCSDGVDNDNDGNTDCEDTDCVNTSNCVPSTESQVPGGCNDGVDNDNDGNTDCQDPDCANSSNCLHENQISGGCSDGVDNDNNGLADCMDSYCTSDSYCVRCFDSFSDVPQNEWYHDYVRALYVNYIVDGCSTNPLRYCPLDFMERRFFAKMLILAMGETPSTVPINTYFDDLTDSSTAPYINRLRELQITDGCDTRQFCPNGYVSRQETAVFLIRALYESPSSAAQNAYFNDLSGSFAVGYINRLYELNLTSGCGSGRFCPFDSLLRQDAAAFAANSFNIDSDRCGF